MHWSTLRALDAVARKGHDRLDLELLDALSRDRCRPDSAANRRAPRKRSTEDDARSTHAAMSAPSSVQG